MIGEAANIREQLESKLFNGDIAEEGHCNASKHT
jgi:hypothetical protein